MLKYNNAVLQSYNITQCNEIQPITRKAVIERHKDKLNTCVIGYSYLEKRGEEDFSDKRKSVQG